MPYTTTRWTSPEPTGFDKMFQDVWDERRDTQVKTFMRYKTQLACLNFATTLKRAADTIVAMSEADREKKIISVFGSYLLLDSKNKKAAAYSDVFMNRLEDDESDFVTKYLHERRIVIVKRGRYTTGCLEFEDGSLGVVSPTTGFKTSADKALKDFHSIDTFYCHLKILTPEQFKNYKD